MRKIELVPFSLEISEFKMEAKAQQKVESFLRCNPQNDGYVFVPKSNGKVKTGAYIKEIELGNTRLIPTPAMVRYYQKSTKKFFIVKQIILNTKENVEQQRKAS